MKTIPALSDIQLKDSPGKPELQVEVDRDEAARLGLPAGAVAQQVRLATQGEVAGKLRLGRREAEIRVRLAGDPSEEERARLRTGADPAVVAGVLRQQRALDAVELDVDARAGERLDRLRFCGARQLV